MIQSKIVKEGIKNYWWAIYISIVIIHLIITPFFPLPWFDETYFASISSGYHNNGTFIPEIAYVAKYSKHAVTYGPFYFQSTSLICEVFGYSAFSFRLLNLVCGLIVPLLFYYNFKKESKRSAFIISILLLIDPFYVYCIHSGRMDAMALVLALPFAYNCYLLFRDGNIITKKWIGSVVLFVIAILTTPRVSIILFPALTIIPLMYMVLKQWKVVYRWLLAIILIAFFYSIWIFIEFGDFASFVGYYSKVQEGNSTAVHGFLGTNFYVPKPMYLLILSTIIVVTLNFRLYKFLPHRAYIIVIPFFFYLLIYDWGMYSIYIIPIFYFTIYIYRSQTYSFKKIILAIALFNGSIFGLRIIESLSSATNKSPELAQNFVMKNIDKKAKVIGSNCYYYALKNNQNPFQIIDKYNTEDIRHELFSNSFDYDYVIISKQEYLQKKNLFAPYLVNCRFVDSMVIQPNKIQKLIYKTKLISNAEKWGYSGYIYKREK